MNLETALVKLRPGSSWSLKTSAYEDVVWLDETTEKPTKEEVQTKIAELQADYDSKSYARARASQYPSIQDQLDMQYHDQVDGTTTWKDAIAKVKADNPKPT